MSAYWTTLRQANPADALVALGRFAAGRDCFLAARGTALRSKSSDLALLDLAGRPLAGQAVIPDLGLDALGVELVLTGPADPTLDPVFAARFARLAQVGALVCRAGLMTQILGQAYAHLEGRESAGVQTLQLPLVKATFSESASVGDRIRREAAKHLEGKLAMDLAAGHAAITAASCSAAKLMGGHGFLAGRANAIETLSLLIAATFAPQASRRSAA